MAEPAREFNIVGIDWDTLLVPKIPLLDVVVRTLMVYAILQVGLRVLGRKNMQHGASYNMTTLFLVGAFGGRAVLGEDTSMTACALGLVLVLAINGLMSLGAYYSPQLARVFEGPPVRQLVKDGAFDEREMRRTRCSKETLLAHLRSKGEDDLGRIRHAFVERTGEVTFILNEPEG